MPWDLSVTIREMQAITDSPIDPRVAQRVMLFADGDTEILRAASLALTPAQLRGGAALPDPLAGAGTRHGETCDALSTAERRLLLLTGLSITQRTSDLLDAAAVDIDVLLFGGLRELLRVEDGQVRIRDERVRSRILLDTDETERREAHAALARASQRRGARGSAAWHRANASGTDAELGAALVAFASARLAQGDAASARTIARFAAETSGGHLAVQAWATAGLAAFWNGEMEDAEEWLGRVQLPADSPLGASVDAALEVRRALEQGPAGTIFSHGEATPIFRAMTTAARGPADREAMAQLGAISDAIYQEPLLADSLQARLFLSASTGVGDRGGLTAHAEAHVVMMQVGFQSQAGDRRGAARLLCGAVRRLPLAHPAAGVISSFVRILAPEGPGLDETIAGAYESIRPHGSMRYNGDGASLGHGADIGSRASAAAGLHRSASQDASDPLSSEPLSARQRQVMTLLSGGLTNREIADKLGLSHRTVEVHVGHILRKHRVTSRASLLSLISGRTRPEVGEDPPPPAVD
ncbi:DNA-binding CsgD family transcriptional regulator [Microbacterium resistens]|uniref:DNA-binding CsgD family transcriptional regulator n=1 Tax=Microbacterium resistens TaxID=156977 RepID=A0ABU1SFB9_9MICO|nr:helix-turn-helix transcriptional regulator [Microbacterium resistens]MDR6867978.1 DNA-binding CsgD family transcriptional regulator [Microbacterium resistens]